MIDVTDREFLAAFNEGDDRVFEKVYLRYYPGLFTSCMRIIRPMGSVEDAKDIVSITFQKLYERRNKIDSSKGITRFLYLAGRTGCIDFLRRKGRNMETPQDMMDMEAVNDELDVELWEKLRQEKRVLEMVGNLPGRSKEVIVLYYLEGLKYREISERLNIAPKTVENLLRYALSKLRTALTDKRTGIVIMLMTTMTFIRLGSGLLCPVVALYVSRMLPQF